MGRGLGTMQLAIMAYLDAHPGGHRVENNAGWHTDLASGIYNARHIAKAVTGEDDRSKFQDSTKQAAFSRALRRLVDRGVIRPLSTVPVAVCEPESHLRRFLHDLADGPCLVVPNSEKWRRRFIVRVE